MAIKDLFDCAVAFLFVLFSMRFYRTEDDFQNKFSGAISENSRNRRKYRNKLTNIINWSSWVVEVLGNVLGMAALFIFGQDDLVVLNLVCTFAACYAYILIPFTYLLNEKGMRQFIMDHGWIEACKLCMKFKRPRQVSQSNGHGTMNLQQLEFRRNQ